MYIPLYLNHFTCSDIVKSWNVNSPIFLLLNSVISSVASANSLAPDEAAEEHEDNHNEVYFIHGVARWMEPVVSHLG